MKILALPRNTGNPYQELLYQELRRRGVGVTYIGSATRSYSLNLLLLPVQLVVGRLAGARVVHLHWVYGFGPNMGDRYWLLRRLCQSWFSVWLWTLRMVGLRLVWTAHNVLPLQNVFADDLRARRNLVSRCDVVIAHSAATITELASLGMRPRSSVVIPHGAFTPAGTAEVADLGGHPDEPRRLLFFGSMQEYKGVEDLLVAFAALPHPNVRLTVAGHCDGTMRSVLTQLAERSPGRVELRLERVTDEELTRLLGEAHAIVLPYRRSTTSGSAMLALGHGRPVVVPDLPGLSELPDEAVFRYDGSVPGLTRALSEAVVADDTVLARMSAAARAYSASRSWPEIADQTLGVLRRLIGAPSDAAPAALVRTLSARN